MNEVMQVYKAIDQKMQNTLLKIQSVHQEHGEAGAKSIGDLEVVIHGIRGIEKNSFIKVSLYPEDGCRVFQDESGRDSIEWENTQHFPTTFQFNTIISREAQLIITVVKNDTPEDIIKEFQIPVVSIIKNEIDEWFSLHEEKPSTLESMNEEETVASLVQEIVEEISEQVMNTTEDIPSIHIAAKVTLSEVEMLAQNVLILSKQKNELELARQAAEKNLTVARAKHEQVTKSQMSTAKSTAQQRRSLLGATTTTASASPAEPPSTYQRYKSKLNSICTPRRIELSKTAGIFISSVLLFHFQGEQFKI